MTTWTKEQREVFTSFENLIKVRQENYKSCGVVLADEIRSNAFRGNVIKISLIILGALVATKGIADQLMLEFDKNSVLFKVVLILYTLVGVTIVILAGLEAAFKYTEKAAGLRLLSAQVKTNIRVNMSKHTFSYNNESFKVAMAALKAIIEEQNSQLKDIEEKASVLGIDLASSVQIDYSIPSMFKDTI